MESDKDDGDGDPLGRYGGDEGGVMVVRVNMLVMVGEV